MTAKKDVLRVYPDAVSFLPWKGGLWRIVVPAPPSPVSYIGVGETASRAWKDAAYRLKLTSGE